MVGIINQINNSHPTLVHLPESDRLRIGRPAKALTEAEFLLVYPIEGPVDYFVRPVARQRRYLEGVHVLVFHPPSCRKSLAVMSNTQ